MPPITTVGVTAATNSSIIIDAGAVYTNLGETNQALLGATKGGNSFVLETSYRNPEIDGVRGPVMNNERIIVGIARMTVNLIEVNDRTLLFAVPGATATGVTMVDGDVVTLTTPTHQHIQRNRKLLSTDYLKNIAIVGEVQGKAQPIIIVLDNALSLGNLEMGFEDKNEAVIPINFTAHYDPANVKQEPWHIYYPSA